MKKNGAIDTVLFDLDGTLLDTAGDFAAALNIVLRRHGRAPLPPERIRPHVSQGGMALVCLGFGIDAADAANAGNEQAQRIYHELLETYRQNPSTHTRLFPGMESLLARIESSGRCWGIVTNKPAFLTTPLLRDMNLSARTACAISGDTLLKRKPWPEPLLHACELIGTPSANAVYIGDDPRDIECGRRAGAHTIAAAYGYIAPGENPREWGADAVVDHPDEIHHYLEQGFPAKP